MIKVDLVKNTITNNDIDTLIEWLKTYPRLTKGKLTIDFEKQWSKWLGCKYSVYVNSGSSANMAMIYAMKCSGRLRNNKVIVPAVSWATTVSPVIQFGLEPVFCDCDKDTLGLDPVDLEYKLKTTGASTVIMVHALGLTCKIKEIKDICDMYNAVLIEDSCETVNSTYNGIKTGNFGLMSTFSYYFGHHASTIEGGMICTDDPELRDMLVMLRSHGWDRDLEPTKQKELREEHSVSDFKGMYTFYQPAFNIRSTDLQAFIGIEQLKKIDEMCDIRIKNYELYNSLIKNEYWKPNPTPESTVSNFAYPIIHPLRDEISKVLFDNGIENRVLISGNMANQPFCRHYKTERLYFAEIVDMYGMYIPNNPELDESDIIRISGIINGVINE